MKTVPNIHLLQIKCHNFNRITVLNWVIAIKTSEDEGEATEETIHNEIDLDDEDSTDQPNDKHEAISMDYGDTEKQNGNDEISVNEKDSCKDSGENSSNTLIQTNADRNQNRTERTEGRSMFSDFVPYYFPNVNICEG